MMAQLQCCHIPSLHRCACTPTRVLLSVLVPWLAASLLLSDVADAGRKDFPGGRLRGLGSAEGGSASVLRRHLQDNTSSSTSSSSLSTNVWIAIGGSILVAVTVLATILIVLWQRQQAKASLSNAGVKTMPSVALSVAAAPGVKVTDHIATPAAAAAAAAAGPKEPVFVPEVFDLKTLEALTSNWGSKHEDGGWSSVYVAQREGGSKLAIKRAKKERKGDLKFNSEVDTLARTRHPNLVPFVGYCSENLQQIVVFEFIKNGPLSAWLRPSDGREPLDFPTRLAVAVDVASAVTFLHSLPRPVVHKDVKSSSILLRRVDGRYKALLGSLGVVKHMEEEASVRLQRKMKYMDPEFGTTMKVPLESDVYSFGIVLLELVTARPADLADAEGLGEEQGQVPGQAPPLAHWALPIIKRKEVETIVDPRMPNSSEMLGPVKELANIAVFCLTARTDRPKMQKVLQRLTGFQEEFGKSYGVTIT